MSGRKLGVASATLLAATAVVNLSMVFYHSLLSRRLGTEYAQLVALMAVSNVLSNITLGLSTSLVKAFSADAELKGPGAVLGRLRSLVLPGGLTLLGATLALLLASPAVAAYLKLPSALLAAMVMLMFANGVLLLVLRAALQGLHHFGWLGLSLMGEGLARVGGALAFSARGAAGGLGAMVLGQAGGIVGAVGGLMGLGQALPPLKRADGVHGWRKAMHEAGSDTLVLTLFAVMAFLDVVVLKHYYDDGRASLYSRAAMVAKSFLYLAGALNLVVLPAAARELAAGRDPRRLLIRFVLAALAVDLLGLAFVWAFTPFCLRLLAGGDPAFQAMAPLTRWFSLAVIPLGLLQLTLAYLLAVRQKGLVPGMALLALAYWLGLERIHEQEFHVVAVLGTLSAVALAVALTVALRRPPRTLRTA